MTQVASMAEPSATRLVRETTGQLTTRDDNDDYLYLPSNTSKRGLYRQYCEHRGKKVVTSASGVIELVDDDNAKTKKDCISWTTFCSFWHKNFPHLKVSQPHEDICKECYIFANCHKYFN